MSRNWWAVTILNYALVGIGVNWAYRDREGVILCVFVALGAFMVYDDRKTIREERGEPFGLD